MYVSSVSPSGTLYFGKVLVLQLELDVAAAGDQPGVLHRLLPLRAHAGDRLERALHLLRRLDVQLLGLVPHPARIVERPPRGDGHQDLVRLRVLAADVVAVGGGDERQPFLAGERTDAVVDRKLFLQRVALDLQIQAVAEDGLQIAHLAPGLVHVAPADGARHRARHAGRQRDDAFVVRLQQRLVDARVVVETLGERLAAQVPEVAVSGLVLRQEHEVVPHPLAAVAHPLVAGDVRLESDDRLDAVLLRLLVEIDHPEHVPVVGDRDRLHPRLGARFHQIREADGAVEQAVEGMQVQMSEVGWHCGHHSAGARHGGEEDPRLLLARREQVAQRRNPPRGSGSGTPNPAAFAGPRAAPRGGPRQTRREGSEAAPPARAPRTGGAAPDRAPSRSPSW